MSISTSTAVLFSADSQSRAMLACVGVSIALHAAVLFSFPELRMRAPSGGPKALTASFAPRPLESSPAVPPAQPRPKRDARPEIPQPALVQPAPIAEAAPQAGEAAPSAQVPSAPESSPGEAAQFPDDVADAGFLERYRLALIDAARRYRRYPPQAMERGWQGRVEIRLVIGADGTIKSASIKTSSHYQLLDDQALDMVKKGKPLTQIPPVLRGREFTLDIPVIFELQTG